MPIGQGYMGVGYLQDGQDFAPSQGKLNLGPAPTQAELKAKPAGVDVSHHQGSINWKSVRSAGIEFAWIKATEGTDYKDPKFSSNYSGAYKAKVIRGAYHFARPNSSSGTTQANFFASHGGGWSKDNLTLPGVLDIEGTCYGKSKSSMRTWITDFYNAYKKKTGRDVVIYTSPSWWNTCTGGWSGMATKSPLWVASWRSSPKIPGGFKSHTIWQYTDSGKVSGISGKTDRDTFNGSRDRLLALANNTR
ncbi:GH25 family lysozyme [Streptomyces sp. NPDC058045]|uniref:GH25 family lysozyme n=1 Tax=Streptomyces sp. NPDC058045 TaxID=3346311 RepID=UPI0036E73FB9